MLLPSFAKKTTIYILKMLNKLYNTRKLVPSFLLLNEVCSSLKFGENVDEKELINILQNIVWITKIKIEENDVSALKLIASRLLKINKHSVRESFNDEKYNIFSIKYKILIGSQHFGGLKFFFYVFSIRCSIYHDGHTYQR